MISPGAPTPAPAPVPSLGMGSLAAPPRAAGTYS